MNDMVEASRHRGRLHQPALIDRSADERCEQRVRFEWPRLQFGVKLHADEPGMVFVFDDLRQNAVWRHAGEAHATLFEPSLVRCINLIAVPMALGYFSRAVNLRHTAAACEYRIIGAKAHGAAKVAARAALLQLVALEPFRHQANDGLGRSTEFRRIRFFDAAQIACSFKYGHLHPETDAEVRHVPLAGELSRADLSFRSAPADAPRH